jgi:hypothetical protein
MQSSSGGGAICAHNRLYMYLGTYPMVPRDRAKAESMYHKLFFNVIFVVYRLKCLGYDV